MSESSKHNHVELDTSARTDVADRHTQFLEGQHAIVVRVDLFELAAELP